MKWCSVSSVRRLHVGAVSVALALGLSACGDDGGGGATVADAGPDGGSSDSTSGGSAASTSNSTGGNSTTTGSTTSGGSNTSDDDSTSSDDEDSTTGGSGSGSTSGGTNSSGADCGALGEVCCGMGFGSPGTCDDGLECNNPAGMGLMNSECITPGSEGDGGETSDEGDGGEEEECGDDGEACCGAAPGVPGSCDDGLVCDTGGPGPDDNVCGEPETEGDAGDEEECGGEGEGCCGAAFGVDGTCDDGLVCDTGAFTPTDNVCVEPVVEVDAGDEGEEDASTTDVEEEDASTTDVEEEDASTSDTGEDAGIDEVDAGDAGDGAVL